MSPDLVIFDCDGVLVDSEPISNAVLADRLTAIGIATTPAQSVERYMGRSTTHWVADAELRYGRPLPVGFVEAFDAACYGAFARELHAVAGIEASLDALNGSRTCVASSGTHEKILRTLGHTGLLHRFEGRIFSATEVRHGKPAPDLFLHAATRMGAEPARCVVVEDAPSGVQAALAAGMAVLGYTERTPAVHLAGDGVVLFDDMAELPWLLERVGPAGRSPSATS